MGFTQEQLAERADLSANYIARLELGEKTPSLGTLVQLAGALGVRVSDFLSEDVSNEWFDIAQEMGQVH